MTVIASVPLFRNSKAFFTSGSAGHIEPIAFSPAFFAPTFFFKFKRSKLGKLRSK